MDKKFAERIDGIKVEKFLKEKYENILEIARFTEIAIDYCAYNKDNQEVQNLFGILNCLLKLLEESAFDIVCALDVYEKCEMPEFLKMIISIEKTGFYFDYD